MKPVQISIFDPRVRYNPTTKEFALFYSGFEQLAWRTLHMCTFRLINHRTNRFRDYRFQRVVSDPKQGLPGWLYSEPKGTSLLVIDDKAELR